MLLLHPTLFLPSSHAPTEGRRRGAAARGTAQELQRKQQKTRIKMEKGRERKKKKRIDEGGKSTKALLRSRKKNFEGREEARREIAMKIEEGRRSERPMSAAARASQRCWARGTRGPRPPRRGRVRPGLSGRRRRGLPEREERGEKGGRRKEGGERGGGERRETKISGGEEGGESTHEEEDLV